MDMKKIAPIISIVSVVIMLLWGMLGNGWSKSWIAVFIGGALIAILNIVNKDKKEYFLFHVLSDKILGLDPVLVIICTVFSAHGPDEGVIACSASCMD